ncbi:hypothetical protein CEN41_20585 [Fischerella thermalis CCMEE 5330]|uniref:Peptidase S1 n=1 Tax=Fischerella thermalis CCMEE 5330 TaxID=2019670 RepID=A0A2N6LZH7_9CYAN|nr:MULTISPECIES: hypothetical protein [Fischerella]PMB39932.1 hypothetical protein CEN41_20585 [Fischerella thermalis CCMEE 5330]
MPRKVINLGIKLSLTIASIAIASIIKTVAVADETPPIFGDVSINPKFLPDPFEVRGMSGGSLPGNQVVRKSETSTGACTGFVDQKPDHRLQLGKKFDYLKLQVDSPEDTTLIITGPGGTWCNDDFDGKNPGIVGEWLPGTYQIWVGSYKKEEYFPYTLKVTEAK